MSNSFTTRLKGILRAPKSKPPKLQLQDGGSVGSQSSGIGQPPFTGTPAASAQQTPTTGMLSPHTATGELVIGQSAPSPAGAAISRPTTPSARSDWERALEIARTKLTGSKEEAVLNAYLSSSTPETVTGIVKLAQTALDDKNQAKWRYTNSRGQVVVFRDRFDSIVKGLDAYMKVGDAMVQHQPTTTSLVWGAFRALMELYLQRLKGLEELENAMKTILKKMAHCEFYANIYRTTRGRLAETVKFSSPNLRSVFMNGMAEALPAFYASVIVFSIKAQLFFQASVLETVASSLKTFEVELQPFIYAVEEEQQNVKELADMAALEQIKSLTKMQSLVEGLDRCINQRADEQQRQAVKDMVDRWLSALDERVMFTANRQHLMEGTCEWILENKTYVSWLEGTGGKIIWIEGIPGAGKSVLATRLIDSLSDRSDLELLYFFYKDGDQRRMSNHEMLACLAAQLLAKGRDVERLREVLKTYIDARAQYEDRGRTFQHLSLALRDLIAGYPLPLVILLDALDECAVPQDAATFISSLAGPQARFILCGRPVVRENFANLPGASTIRMNSESDIALYITSCLADAEEISRFKEDIIDIAIDKSHGMFRYAALLLEELKQPSPERLRDRLEKMPEGIDGMYNLILTRRFQVLDTHGCEVLRKFLCWVCLGVTEVEVIRWLAVTVPGRPFYPEEIVLPSLKFLRTYGSSLVDFEPEYYQRSQTGKVEFYFAHRTVKEYIKRQMKKNPTDPGKLPWIHDLAATETELAHVLLTQILSPSRLAEQMLMREVPHALTRFEPRMAPGESILYCSLKLFDQAFRVLKRYHGLDIPHANGARSLLIKLLFSDASNPIFEPSKRFTEWCEWLNKISENRTMDRVYPYNYFVGVRDLQTIFYGATELKKLDLGRFEPIHVAAITHVPEVFDLPIPIEQLTRPIPFTSMHINPVFLAVSSRAPGPFVAKICQLSQRWKDHPSSVISATMNPLCATSGFFIKRNEPQEEYRIRLQTYISSVSSLGLWDLNIPDCLGSTPLGAVLACTYIFEVPTGGWILQSPSGINLGILIECLINAGARLAQWEGTTGVFVEEDCRDDEGRIDTARIMLMWEKAKIATPSGFPP